MEPAAEAEENAYSGKYCLVSVRLQLNVVLAPNSSVPDGIVEDGLLWDELIRNYWTSKSTKGLQVGVCVPSRCNNDDLDQIHRYGKSAPALMSHSSVGAAPAKDNRPPWPSRAGSRPILTLTLISTPKMRTTVTQSYGMQGRVIGCQDSNDLRRQQSPDSVQLAIIYAFAAIVLLTISATLVERYLAQWTTGGRHAKSSTIANGGETGVCGRPACGILTAGLELLVCFSMSRNWKMFMRNQDAGHELLTPSTWSSPACRNTGGSSAPGTSAPPGSSWSTIDSDANCHHLSSDPSAVPTVDTTNEPAPVAASQFCQQLLVNCQPDDVAASAKTKQAHNPLSHLSGLKLFVIVWITIGHSFLYPSANNYQYYRSIIHLNITRDSVWFATTNFTLGIDMLLYMAGLVFVYKSGAGPLGGAQLHPMESGQFQAAPNSVGVLRFILRKVLRFWPTYLAVIAMAVVLPLVSDGPMWPEMVTQRLGNACRTNWWANLLVVNNFLGQPDICLPSSWFVSVLMQLFLVGSLIIVMARRFSLGLAASALVLLLAGSSAISFALAYRLNVQAPVIRMDESFVTEMDDNIFRLYTNIVNNLGPFLVGMAGGFLLLLATRPGGQRRARCSPKRDNPTNKQRIKWYLLETGVALLVGLIGYLVLSSVFYQHYTRLWAAFYWALHRIGWAIVTGYLIHQCATAKFKLLYDLLSLSTFIPLSRLIFIAYLVYPIYIHVHSGLVRDGLHVSIYNMMNIYITRLVLTFATALVIYLLVELPFCSIETILLNKWIAKMANNKQSTRLHPLLAVVVPVVELQMGGTHHGAPPTKQPNEVPTQQEAT